MLAERFHLRYLKMVIFRRIRKLTRTVCLPLRKFCLPAISLTRTPGGRHMEWAAAFFDPVLEQCERSVYLIGLLCFLLVLAGITMVVSTMYIYVVPYLWATQHPIMFTLYVLYGHYLLVMICFNYFCGVYTSPGTAPKVPNFDPSAVKHGWKVCHKCEAPKPPRAHHCRICNKCVLKMDHHCPWMFNCVGHNNHRYFMIFIVFMWLGTCYVVNCGWARMFVVLDVNVGFLNDLIDTLGMRSSITLAAAYPPASHREGLMLCLQWFVCLGVTIALSILGGWHLYLISVSETTIEFYTNKRDAREMRKEGKTFSNPYHYGCLNNWIVFLGLVNGRTLLRHILLPSRHKPHHDGMDWNERDILCYKDKPRTIPV